MCCEADGLADGGSNLLLESLWRIFFLSFFCGEGMGEEGEKRVGWVEAYVLPYARAIIQGWRAEGFHFRDAIREPRARPSNVSAVRRSVGNLIESFEENRDQTDMHS